jgi:hypothetical protein
LAGLLPEHLAREYDDVLQQYGFIILLLLVLPIAGGSSAISFIVGPLASVIQRALATAAFALASLVR